jgi:hypothetical protein
MKPRSTLALRLLRLTAEAVAESGRHQQRRAGQLGRNAVEDRPREILNRPLFRAVPDLAAELEPAVLRPARQLERKRIGFLAVGERAVVDQPEAVL